MFIDSLEIFEKNTKRPKPDIKRVYHRRRHNEFMKAQAKYAKEKILNNIHRTDIEQYNVLLKEILGFPWPHLKDECLSRKCVSVKQNSVRAKAKVSVLNLVIYKKSSCIYLLHISKITINSEV